jgi:hypothetical protein
MHGWWATSKIGSSSVRRSFFVVARGSFRDIEHHEASTTYVAHVVYYVDSVHKENHMYKC